MAGMSTEPIDHKKQLGSAKAWAVLKATEDYIKGCVIMGDSLPTKDDVDSVFGAGVHDAVLKIMEPWMEARRG